MEITVSNRQTTHAIDEAAIRSGVRSVLRNAPFSNGSVDVAIVDDATIHDLNRRFLDHDWPTDVLSFALERTDDKLEGEIVVSADTAFSQAPDYGWSGAEELLLYVIHGALHLVGYSDQTAAEADAMRAAESDHLGRLGITRAEQRSSGDAHKNNSIEVLPSGGNRRP
jgi:probable rRNA maturation factor